MVAPRIGARPGGAIRTPLPLGHEGVAQREHGHRGTEAAAPTSTR